MVHTTLEVRCHHHLVVSGDEGLVAKRHSDLLQRVAGGLDVVEVRETRREQTEPSDDQVEVAVDTCESVWRNHADNEVENPVGCLSDC
jgi:hypothetical protein